MRHSEKTALESLFAGGNQPSTKFVLREQTHARSARPRTSRLGASSTAPNPPRLPGDWGYRTPSSASHTPSPPSAPRADLHTATGNTNTSASCINWVTSSRNPRNCTRSRSRGSSPTRSSTPAAPGRRLPTRVPHRGTASVRREIPDQSHMVLAYLKAPDMQNTGDRSASQRSISAVVSVAPARLGEVIEHRGNSTRSFSIDRNAPRTYDGRRHATPVLSSVAWRTERAVPHAAYPRYSDRTRAVATNARGATSVRCAPSQLPGHRRGVPPPWRVPCDCSRARAECRIRPSFKRQAKWRTKGQTVAWRGQW